MKRAIVKYFSFSKQDKFKFDSEVLNSFVNFLLLKLFKRSTISSKQTVFEKCETQTNFLRIDKSIKYLLIKDT